MLNRWLRFQRNSLPAGSAALFKASSWLAVAAALSQGSMLIANLLVVSVSLASCSDPDGHSPDQTLAGWDVGRETLGEFPAGAAKILSVGGGTRLAGDDPYTLAVDCAVAVEVVSRMVKEMGPALGSAQIATLRQASDIYREKAANTADDGRGNAAKANATIAAKLSQAQDARMAQGQIAISCLQQLEPSA